MNFASVEDYVAHEAFEQTRVEGDVVTIEFVDRLDPAQLVSRIVLTAPCSCEAVRESHDPQRCTCGAGASVLRLRDAARRSYATQIDLTGAVRRGAH